MSPSTTRVVEQMLDHAAHGRWASLPQVLAPDFAIIEPASLPYGGRHDGVAGYVALMEQIGALFALTFEPGALHALSDDEVLLRMHVTFVARATGRSVRLPVLELLRVRRGRVERSEVFVSDTAALLSTLDVSPAG